MEPARPLRHGSVPAPCGRVRTVHPPSVWPVVRPETQLAGASQEGRDKPGLASTAAWGGGGRVLVRLGKPSGSDQRQEARVGTRLLSIALWVKAVVPFPPRTMHRGARVPTSTSTRFGVCISFQGID